MSYVDHDSPNFVIDGSITIANGLQALPDGIHSGFDFPAYWNPSLRQYLYYDGHNGYDYNLWYQPVYAAAAGKVIFSAFEYPSAPNHGYGRMIMIDHHNGYVTLYGHFSRLLVKRGQKVRRGQKIGISGNTGHSSGPHLHFTVFHNCTPTDPYGWTGPGQDPLQTYQGESSVYLWKRPPLVTNPPPNWPGTGALAAPPAERIVLLRLPSTGLGTTGFTRSLESLARRDARKLTGGGAQVKLDMLRGALLVSGRVTAAQIYALPQVASISSPDTVEGDRADMLAALARAALIGNQHRLVLNRAHHLTGYLLRWQGRVLLVGKGTRGTRVDLRLSRGRGGTDVKRLVADPRTGAYAIDLGRLTPRQYRTLQHDLTGGARSNPVVVAQPVHVSHPRPATAAGDGVNLIPVVVLAVVALLLLAFAAFRLRGKLMTERS